MKRIITRVGILLAVFIATVLLTTILTNNEDTGSLQDLDPATLPEVMIDIDGTLTNRMYGYRQEMQADFIRDSLIPLGTDRRIDLVVKPFNQEIDGLTYEVTTADGSKVVENQSVKKMVKDDDYLKASITLTTSQMRMNQEYSMRIQLDLEDGPVYYYTRIVQRSRLNTAKYVKFVEGFYQKCLNKNAASELADYVEPTATGGSSNYNNVDIHSSLEMITWGSLAPQISRKAVPIIKEMNETTGSIALDYQISAKDGDGNVEYYEVRDFYRMRYTQTRVMLLDFQREARQIFNGSFPLTDSQGVSLGIGSGDVHYMANEKGNVVAFVRGGDLWSYSHEARKIIKIFSFRRQGSSDEREDHGEHDIKILRVKENGDVDFVLYGYMNRGPHEGYTGMAVCRYSSVQNAVEEQVFIPSTLSYEFLKRDLEKLSYVNEDNQLFLLTEGKLYQVDVSRQSFKMIQEDIVHEHFVISSDQTRAAWTEGFDDSGAVSVTEINFETDETRKIKAGKGNYIRALGYMNEDLIYGYASKKNVAKNPDGTVTFPMETIRIENFDGEVRKEYRKEGMYVTRVSVSDTIMEMELSVKSGSGYELRSSENIMNNKKAVEDVVDIKAIYTERCGFVVRMEFKESVNNTEPVMLTAKMKGLEEVNLLDMGVEPSEKKAYYVYGMGGLAGVYTNPAQAINRAESLFGVVLNRTQQYVWERGNRRTRIQLNVKDIPKGVLAGITDFRDLQDAVGEGSEILDLTGCSLDSVLYQVSMQRPVIGVLENGQVRVIVGYDDYNTLLYDPKTKKTDYMGMNDSAEAFLKGGNRFITYIEAKK